jgi:hypothetical protein
MRENSDRQVRIPPVSLFFFFKKKKGDKGQQLSNNEVADVFVSFPKRCVCVFFSLSPFRISAQPRSSFFSSLMGVLN